MCPTAGNRMGDWHVVTATHQQVRKPNYDVSVGGVVTDEAVWWDDLLSQGSAEVLIGQLLTGHILRGAGFHPWAMMQKTNEIINSVH